MLKCCELWQKSEMTQSVCPTSAINPLWNQLMPLLFDAFSKHTKTRSNQYSQDAFLFLDNLTAASSTLTTEMYWLRVTGYWLLATDYWILVRSGSGCGMQSLGNNQVMGYAHCWGSQIHMATDSSRKGTQEPLRAGHGQQQHCVFCRAMQANAFLGSTLACS